MRFIKLLITFSTRYNPRKSNVPSLYESNRFHSPDIFRYFRFFGSSGKVVDPSDLSTSLEVVERVVFEVIESL